MPSSQKKTKGQREAADITERAVSDTTQLQSNDGLVPLPELSNHKSVSVDGGFDSSALHVVLSLYQTFSILDRDQVDKLGKVGLTPLRYNILATLQRANEPMVVGALSAALYVRSNNMSGNINALIDKGLIERKVNPTDSRSFFIELTAEGHEFLNKKLPEHWGWLEKLMSGLSIDEREGLIRLLKKTAHSIQSARQVEKHNA